MFIEGIKNRYPSNGMHAKRWSSIPPSAGWGQTFYAAHT